ncbi:hypothetical protein [Hyalangium sp.]|uniref:hypothetical protein n=1 Tax=Hyalangium sp. TaxID=2028555 RepID=UPI002D4DB580|nr:hypothetical protein [Hyalangium sp.]HYH95495.1 hypothetical protein [Hyalangium sp.]
MSEPTPQPSRLPRDIHIAAVLCLLISGLIGMSTVVEISRLAQLSEYKEAIHSGPGAQGDNALNAHLLMAQFSAEDSMREPRSFLLVSLAVACAFVFVAAARILRPGGLPREGMRRLLCWTSLLAAFLRTIDGAQFQVVVDHMGAALVKGPFPAQWDATQIEAVKQYGPAVLTWFYRGLTAFVAGSFVLLGQYFRSERVRQVVIAQDGPTE